MSCLPLLVAMKNDEMKKTEVHPQDGAQLRKKSPHLWLCPQTAHPKPECRLSFQRFGLRRLRMVSIQHRFFVFLYALTCFLNMCCASWYLGARTIPLFCMCPAKLFGSIFLHTRKLRKWKCKVKFKKWKWQINMCLLDRSHPFWHSFTKFSQKLEGFSSEFPSEFPSGFPSGLWLSMTQPGYLRMTK